MIYICIGYHSHMLYKKTIKQIGLACMLIVISCAQCMQATSLSFRKFVEDQNKAKPSNHNSHTHNKNAKSLSQSEHCLECGQKTCLSYKDKSTKVKNTQCLYCDFPLSTWECFICLKARDDCNVLVQHCTEDEQHHVCGLCFQGLAQIENKCCPLCNTENSIKLGAQPIELANLRIKSTNEKNHADYWKPSEEDKRRQKQIDKDLELALRLSKQNRHDVDYGALAENNNNLKDNKKKTKALPQVEYCLKCAGETCLSYKDKNATIKNTQCLHCDFPLSTWKCPVCLEVRDDCNLLVQHCIGGKHYLCQACFEQIAKTQTECKCPLCNEEKSMKLEAPTTKLADFGIKSKDEENHADYWMLSQGDKRRKKLEDQQRNQERIDQDRALALQLSNQNVHAPHFNGDMNEVDFGMGILPHNDDLGDNNQDNIFIENDDDALAAVFGEGNNNLIDKLSNMLPTYLDAQNSMGLIGVLVVITFTYRLLFQRGLLLVGC